MANEEVFLDEIRQISGMELLRMTDEVGFGAQGAAWIYDAASQHWSFMLFTPMLDTKGAVWIYDRLIKVFQKLKLPEGIDLINIKINSPKDFLFSIMPDIRLPEGIVGPAGLEIQEYTLNGDVLIDYAFVYRADRRIKEVVDRAETFDRTVRELIAA